MQAHPRLNEAIALIHRRFGISSLRGGQLQAINMILWGHDILGLFPTGYGKSLIYRTLSLMLDGITLVISPLISLMKDQTEFAMRIDPRWATFINSTLTPDERRKRLWQAVHGEFKMVYIAPERLRMRDFRTALRMFDFSLLVIDEAHCTVMWGYDFRPDYLKIKDLGGYAANILALTATATPSMAQEIVKLLGGNMRILRAPSLIRKNIALKVIPVRDVHDKFLHLRELLKSGRQTIVYVATRRDAELVADFAKSIGLKAASYHAGLSNAMRTERQNLFMDNGIDVLAATSAFGMGIDKPDIRQIVHWSIPESIEAYYQEVGRAGRDGLPADAVLLFSMDDVELRKFMISNSIVDVDLVVKVFDLISKAAGERREVYLPMDEFLSKTDADETEINVAISVLERGGLIARKPDLTEELVGSDATHKFAIRPLDALGVLPSEVEDAIWDAHFRHNLNIHKVGRTWMTFEIRNRLSPKMLQKIEVSIERMRRWKLKAFERMLNEFVGSSGCREAAVAQYLGEKHSERCGRCDRCGTEGCGIQEKLFVRMQLFKIRDGSEVEKWAAAELLSNGLVRLDGDSFELTDRGTALLNGDMDVQLDAHFRLSPTRTHAFWNAFLDVNSFSARFDNKIVRNFWSKLWKPAFPKDQTIDDFLKMPHPIRFGGERFEGVALDYFRRPEDRRFSDKFLTLRLLERGRAQWNYDLLARELTELVENEGWTFNFVTAYAEAVDQLVVKRISKRIAKMTGAKPADISVCFSQSLLVVADVFTGKNFLRWVSQRKIGRNCKLFVAAVVYRSR